MVKPQPPPNGSVSEGREFLLFCVTFLKLEPPCSQKAPSPQPPPYMQAETYFKKLNVEEEEEGFYLAASVSPIGIGF